MMSQEEENNNDKTADACVEADLFGQTCLGFIRVIYQYHSINKSFTGAERCSLQNFLDW